MKPPSAHRVAVAILLQQTLANDELEPDVRSTLISFLLREVQHACSVQEKTYPELCEELPVSATPVRELLDWKLKSFEYPDDLVEFFSGDLARLLSLDSSSEMQQHLELGSIFGLFVRKVMLEFNQLSFEDVSRLFEALRRYRVGRSRMSMQTCSPARDSMSVHEPGPSRVIEQNGDLKQKASMASPFAIDNVLHSASAVDTARFLKLENAVNAADYEGSLDALHRYFDSCPTRESTIKPGCTSSVDGAANGQTSGSTVYGSLQFALLDLALLHLQLGHWTLALQAAEEAVRIAHQNNDHASLAHALVPLAAIIPSSASPCLLNESTLMRAVARAKELEHWELAAECTLELARRDLFMSHQPGKSLARQSQTSPTFEAYSSLREAFHLIVECPRLLHLAAHANAIQAFGWGLVGCGTLSVLYHRMQLNFGSESPLLACSALCNLACLKLAQGEKKEAIALLQDAAQQYGGPFGQLPLTKVLACIAFDAATDRCMSQTSQHLSQAILAMAPSHDTRTYIDALNCSIRAASTSGRVHEAMVHMEDLVLQSENLGLHMNALNVLLTMAPMLMGSACPELATGVLLKAVSLAEKQGLEGVRAESIIKLAAVLLETGTHKGGADMKAVAQDAQQMIHMFLPQLLESGPASVCGEALTVLAHCHLSRLPSSEQNRRHSLEKASKLLEQAEKSFRACQSVQKLVEVLHSRALVENCLGNYTRRDKAAAAYRSLLMASRMPSSVCRPLADIAAVSRLLDVQ